MAFDLWTHEFCLACDKQTDGAAYCSQSCRLADFEKSSSPSSNTTSPAFTPQDCPWTMPTQQKAANPSPQKFFVSPAYDFSTAQPYGRTPQSQSSFAGGNVRVESSTSSRQQHKSTRSLTPSSSHSSLCSMQSASSTSSSSDMFQLSEKSRRELHAYHMNMEQARMRRRSY